MVDLVVDVVVTEVVDAGAVAVVVARMRRRSGTCVIY